MIGSLLAKIIGTKNERELKRMWPTVRAIGDLEPAIERLSDAELRAKTDEFKARLADETHDLTDPKELHEIRQEVLDEILPEAFAAVRETAKRTLKQPASSSANAESIIF